VLEPSPQLKEVWKAEGAALEEGDLDRAVEVIIDAWLLPDAPEQLRERVARMQRRAFELQAGIDAEEPPDPLDDRPELLDGLDVPTLVAAGEHDMVDFRDGARTIAATIPNVRLEVIEGAGHLAPLEQPQRFRDLLLAFLAEAAPGPGRTQP
jgi:pimeloyl-ACP methyl ester carboxylesterase